MDKREFLRTLVERESELDAAPAPATFTARTDTVYDVPFTRRVVPPDWLITVYEIGRAHV